MDISSKQKKTTSKRKLKPKNIDSSIPCEDPWNFDGPEWTYQPEDSWPPGHKQRIIDVAIAEVKRWGGCLIPVANGFVFGSNTQSEFKKAFLEDRIYQWEITYLREARAGLILNYRPHPSFYEIFHYDLPVEFLGHEPAENPKLHLRLVALWRQIHGHEKPLPWCLQQPPINSDMTTTSTLPAGAVQQALSGLIPIGEIKIRGLESKMDEVHRVVAHTSDPKQKNLAFKSWGPYWPELTIIVNEKRRELIFRYNGQEVKLSGTAFGITLGMFKTLGDLADANGNFTTKGAMSSARREAISFLNKKLTKLFPNMDGPAILKGRTRVPVERADEPRTEMEQLVAAQQREIDASGDEFADLMATKSKAPARSRKTTHLDAHE